MFYCVFFAVFILSVNFLLADSVVLPYEKYENLPIPPQNHDLIKKENEKQQQDTLDKIQGIVKKELGEVDNGDKKTKRSKKKKSGEEKKSKQANKPIVQASSSSGVWESLKNPNLEKIIRELLEEQYKNLDKTEKTVSLILKKVDIKKAFESIGKTSGMQIVVDSDVSGVVDNVNLNEVFVSTAVRLLTSSSSPALAALDDNGAIRITKLSSAIDFLKNKALDRLDRDYKNVCLTIRHAKWNEDLKKRLELLWKGIIGDGSDKASTYIVFDDESKKILCHARQAQVESFKGFIDKIDIEVPQVKIDARIVMASKDFEESLGFDWSGYYDKRANVKHSEFAGFGAKKNDTDDEFFKNTVNWAMNFVPDLTTLSKSFPIRLPFIWGNKDFSSNRINLMLEAAETKDQIRTILKPSLLVNNDEAAEILVGEQMPHETKIAETVEGQPSNITTTQYKDIGMKIKIKTIVAPDHDAVFLDVFVENSYIARPKFKFNTLPGQEDGGFNYVIETSRSKNRVLLKSGQTTMIGGLIINTQERVQTGIPYLQDIPVLGLLFQGRRKAVLEKQLLIFITPTIV